MQLLISVIDGVEAQAALRGCADIIDVKNPVEGALGAAPLPALRDICALLPPNQASSAALGDAVAQPGMMALAAYGAAQLGASYVKMGLRAKSAAEAVALLQAIRSGAHLANAACRVVAVGYADAHLIGAVACQRLPQIAQEAEIWGCMIDTAVKDGRSLFDHCAEADLASWLADCRRAGLGCALAGSLTLSDVAALRRLKPDVVGFRGAACRGDRATGRVDAVLVSELRAALLA